MATDILTRLSDDVLIMYAPMQTLLLEWGKDQEEHLSDWVLKNPDKFQEALAKSFEAGCEMGHTATQASSPFRAKPFGQQDRIHELNLKSAELAREVTPEGCFVIGNISGSNPDFMEPYGAYTEQFLYDGYKEQILALAEGGVDAFHISGVQADTISVAVRVAKELTGLPVMSFNSYFKGKKGIRTMMGYTPQQASTMVDEAGADAIGAICGLWSYEDGVEILRAMHEGTNKPLGCQPDAGLPDLVEGETVHPATPDDMARWSKKWISVGCKLLGGCCGTTLEHYRCLAKVVQDYRQKGGR
jgi:5-methyltetrahydrofolate--homocysteine methyltransferase